ncbi:hypothetical protein H1R20_g7726, partial [Candolleomyces eurysporus]
MRLGRPPTQRSSLRHVNSRCIKSDARRLYIKDSSIQPYVFHNPSPSRGHYRSEDMSDPGITIDIVGPDSQTEVPVGLQCYGQSWLPFPPVGPGPSLRNPEAASPSSSTYREPTTGLPSTVGDAPPLTLPEVGVPVYLHPIQTMHLPVAMGYPASNSHWVPETLTGSPRGDEGIDEFPLLDFSPVGDGQTQPHPDSYSPSSPIQNHPPINWGLLSVTDHGHGAPSNQGLGTPYYTPPESFDRSLSPYSASPVTGTPSPSSPFPSPLLTTPDDELSAVSMEYPYLNYDATETERGRSWLE